MILWFVYNVSEVWDWLVYCAWYEGFPSLFFSPVLFSGTNSLGWGFSPPPPLLCRPSIILLQFFHVHLD